MWPYWKLRASITDCVGENLFTHDSKISKIVFNPKLLSMLENMFTTSNATTIDSHGKFNLLSSSTMLSICDVCSVITWCVFQPSNSFMYVLPSTCYSYKNIPNVPKRIAWRLRRNCDTDKKYNQRFIEYQNYLIGR